LTTSALIMRKRVPFLVAIALSGVFFVLAAFG
jgi:hypothetical protein